MLEEDLDLWKKMSDNGGSYSIADDGTVYYRCYGVFHTLDKKLQDFYGDRTQEEVQPGEEEYILFYNYLVNAWNETFEAGKEEV